MLKKILLTQTLFLIMVFTTQAQNNQDLINYIESQKEEIEDIIKLSTLKLEIKPIKVEGFKPYNQNNFTSKDLSAFDNEDSLKKLIEEFTDMYVDLTYPYNFVDFYFDDDEYAEYQGKHRLFYHDYPEELPFYEPIEIRFKDGTTEKVNEYVNHRLLIASYKEKNSKSRKKLTELEKYFLEETLYTGNDQVGFYTSKPIESIKVKVSFNAPEFTDYRFSQSGEIIETPDGNIELDAISGDQLSMKFPAPLKDRFTILPLYEDGRVLREQSSGLNYGFGEKAMPKLKKTLGLYDQALAEVKSGKLNSTDEIDAFMEALITENKLTITEEDQVAEKHLKLRGPISEVLVKIKNEKLNSKTFTYEIPVHSYEESQSSKEEPRIVEDFKSEKYGLLDIHGNWIVQPEYSYLYGPKSSHFYREEIDEKDSIYYFFNTKDNKLEQVDFIPNGEDPRAERYVLIQKEENGAHGVFDVKQQEIVIPISDYKILRLVEDRYWFVKKINETALHTTWGIIDEKGEIIIPPKQNSISYNNGFFYVINDLPKEERLEVFPSQKKDIYNLQGTNITQGKYNTIEGGFGDGLQLVMNKNNEKIGENKFSLIDTEFYFIDKDGKVILELSDDDYEEVHPFENGLARLKNTAGHYGFIDIKGEIVLPFEYDLATDFKGIYALIEYKQDDQIITAFIDKKGDVINILPDSYRYTRCRDDKPYVVLENGDKYGFDAKPFQSN